GNAESFSLHTGNQASLKFIYDFMNSTGLEDELEYRMVKGVSEYLFRENSVEFQVKVVIVALNGSFFQNSHRRKVV
ncbi:hypothetical protein B0O44_1171, partial [Pedobacter nutrimenti]